MATLEQKYVVFGNRLATHLQRLYRGQCGRTAARLERWQKYQTSAFIIQRAYREHVEWLLIITHTVLRRLQQSSHLSQNLKANMAQGTDGPSRVKARPDKGGNGITKPVYGVPQPTIQPTSVNFTRCLRNKGTFDEKMSVWRAIIELRRGHRNMSTHICMKAMLESNGDISRAMVLMGDETYHLKNEGDVPLHLRTMFMPYLRDEDYLPKITSPGGSPGQRLAFNAANTSKANTGATIGLDGIRKIKAGLQGQEQRQGQLLLENWEEEEEEEDNGLDLTDIIAWTYFSKYYESNPYSGVPPCCRPKPITVVPSSKPINAEERKAMEEKKNAALMLGNRPRSVSPIVTTGSPGFSTVGSNNRSRSAAGTGGNRRSFRGDSRSPSPTNKFSARPGAKFGAPQSTGRPTKLKRKVAPNYKSPGQGVYGHVPGMGMTNENVFNRQHADAALLTSLLELQSEMDRTQRD